MRKIFTLLMLLLCIYTIQAGTTKTVTGWTATLSNDKVFIENKGQFDVQYKPADRKVLFAIQQSSKYIYFTDKGITYHFYNATRNEEHGDNWQEELKEKKEKYLNRLKKEEEKEEAESEKEVEGKYDFSQEFIAFTWKDASPAVQLIASDTASDYHTYCIATPDKKNAYAIENIKGYHKLLYKNLYAGIDVEYTFDENISGFKYSVIVHPGADPSLVKMVYDKNREIEIGEDGNLEVHTSFGEITEKAPLTFYNDDNSATIGSRFTVKNGTVGFNLKSYDKNKTLVIDPWVQSPTFNTAWDCVWECEKDAAGNVYVIGGVMPMQLLKYNTAGALQWTYSTPYDTSNVWLGTFATDAAGNSYVTAGSVAQIQKISTAGSLVWNNASPGGIFGSTEFWNITFNCDQTKLVIGGTGGTLPPLPFIYQVDMANGNVTNSLQVTGGALFPTQEVRSITASGNGRYYWLSHDSIGFIKQNFSVCPTPSSAIFKATNSYALSYKCENWRKDNSGIMALRTYGAFAFTHKGSQLHKRNFSTGAIIGTATVPGGGFASNQVQNSGMDIDNCGNIYVGSKNQVVKYDQNLTQLATYATTFNVYDVHVSTGGDIIACGSTGTSTSGARTGSVQVISAGACATIAIVCCDANICQPPTFCTTSAPYTLTPSTPGGVWSGPGVNASTGVFTPSVAGVGTHTIVYTLPCGSDSVQIVVSPCTTLSVCIENNGNLTASNGVAPYSWQQQTTTQNCSACFPAAPPIIQPCSTPPGCAVNVTSWATYTTGTTVAPPAAYPIQVVDGAGTVLSIANAAQLQPCTICPTITVTASNVTNVTCPSTNNGSITVGASGGTGSYTYTWSPNVSSTATASNLTAGTYTVTAKDANNCSGTLTVTVTAPNLPNITTASASPETCQGQNNASITSATATGGNGTYTWTYAPIATPGNTTAIPSFPVNNLTPGNYILTVTSGGCTDTFQINVPAGPVCCTVTATSSTTQPTCGQNNGSITITPNPAGSYNYTWSNSLPNQATQNNLGSGQYTVTVTSTTNSTCSTTATVNLSNSGGPTLSFSNPVNPTCAGGNGSVTVTLAGGTAPYQVTIDTGGTAQTITVPIAGSQTLNNLSAGTITVTVQDAAGCQAVSSTTLTAPTNCCTFTLSATQTQPGCSQSNGSITVTPANGSGNYSYSWGGGQTTNSITGQPAGNYYVTVTDNGFANCTRDTSFTLNNPNAPMLTFSNPVNPTCAGSDGSVTVTLAGGTAPYQVTIDTGGTAQTITVPIAGSQNITNLSAGTITVTVQDANGCQAVSATTLTAPTNCCTFTLSATQTQPGCSLSNGSITVTPANGSGNYSYNWGGGQTTNSINNQPAGNYYVTVTDNGFANCTRDTSFTLNNPNAPTLTATNPVNPTCAGNDGSLTVGISGGQAPYQVTVDTGGTPQTFTLPFAITQTVNNLPAGTVTVSVTDAAGCTASSSVTLTAPNCCTFTLSAALTQPACGASNGSIAVTAANGSGNYSYSWAGGQTTSSISNQPAGTYYVTVTDNAYANCTRDTSFTLANPNAPTLSTSNVVNPTCAGNDGSLTVSLSGGQAPYQVTVDTGGTPQTFTLPFPISQALNNLPAGTVTISVTDAAGCSATTTVTLTAPANCCTFTVSTAITQPNCGVADGSIALTATNGSGNYSYSWAGGQTTATISSISAGVYMVTITDNAYANCTRDTSFTLSNPNAPVINPSTIVKETCPGTGDGTATINATGGTGSYTYNWSNGQTTVTATGLTAGNYNFTVTDASNCQATGIATVGSNFCCTLKTSATGTNGSCGLSNASISVSITTAGVTPYTYSLNGGAPQSSGNFTGLAAGAYTIITTDGGGCKDTTTVTILPSSNTLSVNVTTTNVTCNGGNDGTATVTPTGGTAPITFVWSTTATSSTITGLAPDIYTVTATDGSGCSGTASGSLIQPPPLTVSLGSDTSFCEGGTALLDAGTGFVAYAWSSGQTTQTISPATSGTYMVTVTNSVGCTASDVVLVNVYPNPTVDLGEDKTGYEGQHLNLPALINPAPIGNNGTFVWSPSTGLACTSCQNNMVLVNDTITYSMTYTDIHGCTGADTVNVYALSGGLIFFPNAFTPGQDGKNDIYLPLGDQVKFIAWRIFNRIGEKVFDSNSMVIGWDGNYKGAPSPPNVYVYTAEVTFMNGINQKYKGSITLLR
ncbi:MAG: gliding motility-associated C-terminal domain-containing protein [Chitinophagales bacterium]